MKEYKNSILIKKDINLLNVNSYINHIKHVKNSHY